ncbi:MAG TPA: GNAT family N-acetyltransferase [Ornithinibacter sp.]|nr:GNAT family N-acetyltransferase [Ornithinibacter sp.]
MADAVQGVRVRTAGVDDLPVLRDVYRRSSLSNPEDVEALLARPELLVLADSGVRSGWTRVAVGAGGDVLGFATAVPGVDGTLELDDLFVDPSAMGRGVGRLLVADVVARSRRDGVERVDVTASPASRGFYERVGFVAVGEVALLLAPGIRMHLHVRSDTG